MSYPPDMEWSAVEIDGNRYPIPKPVADRIAELEEKTGNADDTEAATTGRRAVCRDCYPNVPKPSCKRCGGVGIER